MAAAFFWSLIQPALDSSQEMGTLDNHGHPFEGWS